MADARRGIRAVRSFQWRVILLLTVVVGAAQAISTARIITSQNATMWEMEQTKGDLLAEIAARSLVESLKLEDPVQTIRNLEVLRSDPAFTGAEVLTADGKTVASVRSDTPVGTSEVLSHVQEFQIGGRDDIDRTMQVVVHRSLDELHARQETLTQAKTLSFLTYVIAFGAALVLVTTTIFRPLAQIRESIGRIRDGQLTHPIPNLNRKDEVGEVARALELFRTNALEMRCLREGREQLARQDRHRILRALEATQDAVLILSETGRVEFANPRAQAYFQHAVLSDAMLFANVPNEDHRHQIETAIAEGKPMDLTTELRIDSLDLDIAPYQEEPLPVAVRINPITEGRDKGIGTVILVSDNSFQERIASRIRRLADFDSLTGLHNRRVLEERLNTHLADDPEQTALMLLDLDRFKVINDTLGHPVGDELLVNIAGLLQATASTSDLAARMGGDEFAMLVTGPDAAARAAQIAERVIQSLSRPVRLRARTVQTGASIGIATADGPGATAQDIVRKADLALYAAKQQGRGRATRFAPHMEENVQRKSMIEEALREALAKHQITAHFQRQSALNDGSLIGFEALARWTDEKLGPVSPGEFVPVAEETGLIRELTIQMLNIACRFAAEWRDLGFSGRVSVNISPHLFSDDVTEMIRDSLMIHNCPAEALVIEITEAVFLSQGNDAKDQIMTLQSMGVTVALDDFGMGFSSLSYLQRFPVNSIKIDRAFVSRILESSEALAIVRAIIELGHALGMTVTGEGAETEDERAALAAAGADVVQGYVDGRPMTRENALALIAQAVIPADAARA